MAKRQPKRELLRFLDKKAFNPVLQASPDRFSGRDKKTLERMKGKTETQKERYRNYKGAGQIRQEFQSDLHSSAAKKVHADLQRLGLPSFPDVQEDFFELADDLGVTPERQERRSHKPHPPHPWHKKKPEEREKAWHDLKRMAEAGDVEAKKALKSRTKGNR